MHAELYMISVKYKHSELPNEQGYLPITTIDVGQKINERKEGEWVVQTHYRESTNDFIRQIAFRFNSPLEKGDRVYLHEFNGKTGFPFHYDATHDIWFQPTCFEKTKRRGREYYQYDNNQMLVGLTNAGSVCVSVVRERTCHAQYRVYFVPSSLKLRDYEEMVSDLYRIREEFVRDERNVAKTELRQDHVLMILEEQLEKLRKAIIRIDAQPHAMLKLHSVKKKISVTGRFDIRAEIEQYMSPGQPTYKHRIMSEVVTTYENQLIKQLLQDLLLYAERHGETDAGTNATLRRVQNQQKAFFEKSDMRIQAAFQSLDEINNPDKFEQVYHQFQNEADQHLAREQQIHQITSKNSDFYNTNKMLSGLSYIELSCLCSGTLKYSHNQSLEGLQANFSYNKTKSSFYAQYYTVQTPFGKVTKTTNSYFGNIQLISNHAQSHALLYEAFNSTILQKTNERLLPVVLKGYVKPAFNGIDPVCAVDPHNKRFNLYSFQFVYLDEVIIDGRPIDVPQTKRELLDILTKIPVEIPNSEVAEEAEIRLNQLQQLRTLQQKKHYITKQAADYEKLRQTVEQCLTYPLFQKVQLQKRLVSRPTQLFLHDPNYRSVWQAIKRIEYELSASLYTKEHGQLIGTTKVEQIYEVWTLYKILQLATQEMGWLCDNKSSVREVLDNYMLEGKSLKQFSTKMYLGEWTIELYYEPVIHLQNGSYVTPDFVLRYIYKEKPVGLAILDAKYRNYDSQGEWQWIRDVEDVAMNKYGQLQPIDSKWQLPLLHSGIIHCDEAISNGNEERYNPYHVMYNEKLFPNISSVGTEHLFGSLYMIPSQIHVFKNWFRMIFEYHLKSYNCCWNCGERQEVSRRPLSTRGGNRKYHYTCKKCNEFWVKVHCANNGHHLVKHTLNYHLQVNRNQRWFVVCPIPICLDGTRQSEFIEKPPQ